jgi:hypothetical protein
LFSFIWSRHHTPQFNSLRFFALTPIGRTRRPGNHSVLLPNASLTAVAGFSPPNLTAMASAAAIVESVAATTAEAA